MAHPQLEAILAALFDAEFCERAEKETRVARAEALLATEAERAGIPIDRLKQAIRCGRYSAYRRARLARELPTVPPRLRAD